MTFLSEVTHANLYGTVNVTLTLGTSEFNHSLGSGIAFRWQDASNYWVAEKPEMVRRVREYFSLRREDD